MASQAVASFGARHCLIPSNFNPVDSTDAADCAAIAHTIIIKRVKLLEGFITEMRCNLFGIYFNKI